MVFISSIADQAGYQRKFLIGGWKMTHDTQQQKTISSTKKTIQKKNQTKLNVTTRSTELTLQQLLSNY